VLLNSGYQLLNYIINELKRIVEQTNVLEPGQGGGRQGRSVNINMQKMHFVTHEAHRQGKRVYRVDIDFRNAFNAMSRAAFWHVMNMFHIPDVDLLEQIYDSAIAVWLQTTLRVQQSRLIQVQRKEASRPRNCTTSLSTLCCGCSRRLGRIRGSVMVCRLARTRMTAVKTPTKAISLLT